MAYDVPLALEYAVRVLTFVQVCAYNVLMRAYRYTHLGSNLYV